MTAALSEGAVRELDVLAREVHAAWRDGMLAQGREVAPHRMTWETLSADDHVLDAYIAERVTAALRTQLQQAQVRAEAAEKELAEIELARDPRNVFADPTIGCANCGRPIAEAGRVITGGLTDGEWVCSDACDAELSELGCPHESSADYRPRFEDRPALAAALAGDAGA